MAAYFVVQSFSTFKGQLRPDLPIQAQNTNHAKRVASRLAEKKPMVIAFSREGDPTTGDFGDPKLIFSHGEDLPEELRDMEKV